MPKRGSGKRAAKSENPSSSGNGNVRKEAKDKEHDVVDKPDSKKRKTMTQSFRMKIEHWYVHSDTGETTTGIINNGRYIDLGPRS